MIDKRHPLRISIVGAGAVGSTLALLFSRRGHRIVSVVSQNLRDARRCATLARCRLYSTSLQDLHPSTDLILIATPDNVISSVASSIVRTAHLSFPKLIVCHTSGAQTSRTLEPLRRKGSITFSFHPIQTFPASLSPLRRLRDMEKISYGVEGSPRGIRVAQRLARSLGGRIFIVPKERKILYHLTCVIASNYSTALVGTVDELAARVGGKRSLRHFARLIGASVMNAIAVSPSRALTGPIARGDTSLISKHLKALRQDRDLAALYRQMGIATLKLALRGNKLSAKQGGLIRKILADSA